jgi:hypothetical protein
MRPSTPPPHKISSRKFSRLWKEPLFTWRDLPAIAAIASVTSIAAASTATAVASAAATATPPAAVSAAPATAAAAFCLRPCFIHHEVTPAEILPVQGVYRAIRIVIAVHFDECEPARLPCKTVTN